jgi:hypothetical protein
MLASFPASMVNQNRSDLGILNRFNLTPSRSSAGFPLSCGDLSRARLSALCRLSVQLPPLCPLLRGTDAIVTFQSLL